MHAEKSCSNHHDQQQHVDLTAIHSEIKCSNAHWDYLFSALVPALSHQLLLNGAEEPHSSKATMTGTPQSTIRMMMMMMTTMSPLLPLQFPYEPHWLG